MGPHDEVRTREQAEAVFEQRLPFTEEFMDCSGVKRKFLIYRNQPVLTIGYYLCAMEVDVPENAGYRFEVLADYCPATGLGKLYDKIREGLSRKHLYLAESGLELLSNTMSGRFVFGGVAVDGRHISWDELTDLLATRFGDGKKFELKITDMTD